MRAVHAADPAQHAGAGGVGGCTRQQRDVGTASFDRGYCHITIPKVEAVVHLGKNAGRWASRWRDRNGMNGQFHLA